MVPVTKENASIRFPGQRRRARYHSALYSESIRKFPNALSVTGTAGSDYSHFIEEAPKGLSACLPRRFSPPTGSLLLPRKFPS